MKPAHLALALLALGSAGGASAAPAPGARDGAPLEHVAVLEFTGTSVSHETVVQLAEEVRTAAVETLRGRYNVLTKANQEAVLRRNGVDLETCAAEGCDIDLLRTMSAKYGVTGSVVVTGTTKRATLQVYDVARGVLLDSERIKAASDDELVDGTYEAARRLFLRTLVDGQAPAPGATMLDVVTPGPVAHDAASSLAPGRGASAAPPPAAAGTASTTAPMTGASSLRDGTAAAEGVVGEGQAFPAAGAPAAETPAAATSTNNAMSLVLWGIAKILGAQLCIGPAAGVVTYLGIIIAGGGLAGFSSSGATISTVGLTAVGVIILVVGVVAVVGNWGVCIWGILDIVGAATGGGNADGGKAAVFQPMPDQAPPAWAQATASSSSSSSSGAGAGTAQAPAFAPAMRF